MNRRYYISILFIFILIAAGCSSLQPPPGKTLFQASIAKALFESDYDGEMTLGELKKHGDFGIGTFDNLDGEMIAVNGFFYQIKSDGAAYSVTDSQRTPFAAVTFFQPDKMLLVDTPMDFVELEQFLNENLPTKNIFYAIRIKGTFDYIKTRSVPRQEKPYPPLVDIAKKQPVFEFNNAEGTIAGFRCPEYVKDVNIPGYHFHFLTKDRKYGGHVIALDIRDVRIDIEYINNFEMDLKKGGDFYKLDLTKDKEKDVKKVEK